MNYTFVVVFKKDLDEKGNYDLDKHGVKRSAKGSNLKRAISTLERQLIEEGKVESKSDVIILDRVSF